MNRGFSENKSTTVGDGVYDTRDPLNVHKFFMKTNLHNDW